jgi:hypothetical protein
MLSTVSGTFSRIRRCLQNAGIGKMHTIRIRALIFRENGFWIAQCLEHDIAVQSHSQNELVSELAASLASYAEMAIDEGREPFSDIPPAPARFEDMFKHAREWSGDGGIKVLDQHEAPRIVPTLRVFQPQPV